MPHHVYTTEGFVLHMRPLGESNKLAFIFTEELGLLKAIARGIREEKSRLRTTLIPFSWVKVSLVRGKASWRVTTVTLLKDFRSELGRREAERSLGRVSSLLLSLLHGEEKNKKLYEEFESSLGVLESTGSESLLDWELWTVTRLLSPLGYVSKNDLPESLVSVREQRKKYLALVNERLKETGLYKV